MGELRGGRFRGSEMDGVGSGSCTMADSGITVLILRVLLPENCVSTAILPIDVAEGNLMLLLTTKRGGTSLQPQADMLLLLEQKMSLCFDRRSKLNKRTNTSHNLPDTHL